MAWNPNAFDYARSAGEARYPHLYRGLVGAWSGSLNPQRGRILNGLLAGVPHGQFTDAATTVMPTWGTTTARRNALILDGSSNRVVIPSEPRIRPAMLSVSLWAQRVTTPVAFDTLVMHSSTSNWDNGFGMYWGSATLLRCWVSYYTTYAQITIPDPLAWNHYVLTWDGATIRAYCNGIEGTSAAFAGNYGTPTNLHVGGGVDYSLSGRWMHNGPFGDLLLHNRPLTLSEITDFYKLGSGGWAEPRTRARIVSNDDATIHTGSGAVSLGGMTCSGAATHAPPIYTGSGAVSLGGMTCSGAATHTPPIYTGSGALSLGGMTCSGAATHTPPGSAAGVGSLVLGGMTCSGAATLTAPGADNPYRVARTGSYVAGLVASQVTN